MDRETEHELQRLLEEFTQALDEIRLATFDPERSLAGWHRVQTCGWRLNQLLPGLDRKVA